MRRTEIGADVVILQLSELTSDQLLEWYTAEALRRRGYDVRPSKLEEIGKVRIGSDDRARQIDVHAEKLTALGITEHLLVECKCHKERIGAAAAEVFSTAVNEIRGKLAGSVQGLFVSTSELAESARTHLLAKGIQIFDGPKVRELIGSLRFDAVMQACEREGASEQLLREYFFKIRFPAKVFCEEVKISGVSEISLPESRLAYVPLLFCKFEVPLETELPGMGTSYAMAKSVMFMVRFVDNHPVICDDFEGLTPDQLAPSASNLSPERTMPSALLPSPNMVDPLIEQLVIEEASRRAETTVHYSPIINEWTEDDPERLRKKVEAELDQKEEFEVNERRRDDDDRILDLDQKISELRAESESRTEELQAIEGLEESSRQIRHRATLQGKITSAALRISGYEKQKRQIQARIDRDIDLIRTKYRRQSKEAIKRILVRPERNQLVSTEYAIWIPKFEGTLSLDNRVQFTVEWNGASGIANLGTCSKCGLVIRNDNGALCNICLRVICEEDSVSCSKCLMVVCVSDSWDCPTCGKQWCNREQRLSCSFCGRGLCLTCRIICTECGALVCKEHSTICVRCTRTLCQRHAICCAICACFICGADLISCEGCNRYVCRIHTHRCPTCTRTVCEDCNRKRLNLRNLLKGHGREKRCVLCMNQSISK